MIHTSSQEYFEKTYDWLVAGKLESALLSCKMSLRIDPEFRPAYLRIGQIYSHLREYKKALNYYHIFLKKSLKSSKDPSDLIQVFNAIGQLYVLTENYSEALQQYSLALDIARKKNNKKGKIQLYHNLALCHKKMGKLDQAQLLYQKALKLIQSEKKPLSLAYHYFNIAMLLREQKKYRKSIRYLKKSKKLYPLILKKRNAFVLSIPQ